jgi:hypothetical protein
LIASPCRDDGHVSARALIGIQRKLALVSTATPESEQKRARSHG